MKKHIVLLIPMPAFNAANAGILFERTDGLFLNEFARKLVTSERTYIARREEVEGGNALKVFTFHDGSTQAWAPIGADGMYSTEYTYSDELSSESLH